MNASSDVFNFTDQSFSTCWIELDGSEVNASERSIETNGPTSNQEENCASNVTVPVLKGTHTVRFMASPGSVNTTFDETSLDVIFIPFGANGKAPTSFALPRTAAPVPHARANR